MSVNWLKSSERGVVRRAFLGGAATVVALPFLESLVPRAARAQGAAFPKRLIYYFVPNGINMATWRPSSTGPGYPLSPALMPLAPLQKDFMIISGTSNAACKSPTGAGDHGAGTAGFLTGAKPNHSLTALQLAPSADQIAADAIGKYTRIPKIALASDAGTPAGNCDNGYACAYSNSISWANATTPITNIFSPQMAFNTLFMGFDRAANSAAQMQLQASRKSVLDAVTAQAQSLSNKLGTTDRAKLDQYLTSVRELETQLLSPTGSVPMSCQSAAAPATPVSFEKTVQTLSDIMVLAMQCDVTRIFSFQCGASAGGPQDRSFPNLGISGTHHTLSHHNGLKANLDKLTLIDTYQCTLLGYLLSKMKGIPEGGDDLLYNSTVFFSSDVSDGNTHSHNDMPVLVAGHGGGLLKTGQHVSYPTVSEANIAQGVKYANILATTLKTVGVSTPVGISDGVLPELIS
jgi:hypothetical protein